MPTWYESYLASWETLDVDAVLAWFADDCVFEDTTLGHGATGIDQLRRFVAASFRNMPDARFEFVRGHDNGTGYAIEWIMQPMGVRGASVGQLRDGKIAVHRDYWNGAAYTVPTAGDA
jgi:ketosteroid isomerase-like protein